MRGIALTLVVPVSVQQRALYVKTRLSKPVYFTPDT